MLARVFRCTEIVLAEHACRQGVQPIACICEIQPIGCYLHLQSITCIVLEYGPETYGGLSDQDA